MLRVRLNERCDVPANLLRCRLLPGTSLPRNALPIDDSPLHGLLLKGPSDSCRIVLHLRLLSSLLVRFELAWLPRVHLGRLLRDQLDCEEI